MAVMNEIALQCVRVTTEAARDETSLTEAARRAESVPDEPLLRCSRGAGLPGPVWLGGVLNPAPAATRLEHGAMRCDAAPHSPRTTPTRPLAPPSAAP